MQYEMKWNKFGTLLILIFEILIVSLVTPSFLTLSNFMSIGNQVSITGIVAVGMIFVLVAGGIDLSVSGQMALSGILSAWLMVNLNIDPWLSSMICIIICILLGMINGLIISKIDINPFIITMAVSIIYRGLAKMINKGMPIYGMKQEFLDFTRVKVFTMPLSVVIFMLCIFMGIFMLNKTYFGKYFYALGADEKIAELAGLHVRKIKVMVYALCGFFTGIASVISLSRIGSAQPTAGTGLEFEVLAAAALGGISFKGGRGKIFNLIMGVWIMQILGNQLILFNVGDYYRNIIKGLILLFAIGMDKSTHTTN